jgi:hypothetical protein
LDRHCAYSKVLKAAEERKRRHCCRLEQALLVSRLPY